MNIWVSLHEIRNEMLQIQLKLLVYFSLKNFLPFQEVSTILNLLPIIFVHIFTFHCIYDIPVYIILYDIVFHASELYKKYCHIHIQYFLFHAMYVSLLNDEKFSFRSFAVYVVFHSVRILPYVYPFYDY